MPNVSFAPYLARVRAEREPPLLIGEALSRGLGDIAKTMFTLHELHDKEMKDKYDLTTSLIAAFGPKNVGQPLLDERANAFDAMFGRKAYPRGPDGHALPPRPSEEDAIREGWNKLTPEQQEVSIKEHYHVNQAEDRERKFQLASQHNATMERISQQKYDLLRIQAQNPKGMDADSGRIWDPAVGKGGGFRNTLPGETGRSFRQMREWFDENKITLDNLTAMEKLERIKLIKHKLQQGGVLNDVQLGSLMNTYAKLKDPAAKDTARLLINKTLRANDIQEIPEDAKGFAAWLPGFLKGWNSAGVGGAAVAGEPPVPMGTTGAPAPAGPSGTSGWEDVDLGGGVKVQRRRIP